VITWAPGKRTDLHRLLGVAGGALAALMLIVGYFVAISAARRTAPIPGMLMFLIVPVRGLHAVARRELRVCGMLRRKSFGVVSVERRS